eukprot:Pgem_evm2s16316
MFFIISINVTFFPFVCKVVSIFAYTTFLFPFSASGFLTCINIHGSQSGNGNN